MLILKLVIVLAIILFSLIIPIIVSINVLYVNWQKRLYFNINLYGILNILSGYIEKIDEGLIIHLNKKAIIVKFNKLFGMKSMVQPFKDFLIIKFNSLIEIGSKNNQNNAFIISYLINYINFFIGRTLYFNRPFIDYKNDVNIYEDKDVFNVYIKLNVILNVLVVLISIIKIIWGKLFNGKKHRQA